jgi:hypothetical protein
LLIAMRKMAATSLLEHEPASRVSAGSVRATTGPQPRNKIALARAQALLPTLRKPRNRAL